MPSKPKIYESPDGGKTVFEREFGDQLRTAIDKEMSKQFRRRTTGEKLYGYHPQELLTNKILPIDIFYKLFGESK
jgi:hypothetical protein